MTLMKIINDRLYRTQTILAAYRLGLLTQEDINEIIMEQEQDEIIAVLTNVNDKIKAINNKNLT